MSTSSEDLTGESLAEATCVAEGEKNLYDLFARQVQVCPDAIAVVAEGETLTYAELAEQVSSLGNLLTQRGLVAEQPVGVLMHRSVGMLATLLAILRAGAAYLPLDPDDPVDRHRRMLAISGCSLVLAHVPCRSWQVYRWQETAWTVATLVADIWTFLLIIALVSNYKVGKAIPVHIFRSYVFGSEQSGVVVRGKKHTRQQVIL